MPGGEYAAGTGDGPRAGSECSISSGSGTGMPDEQVRNGGYQQAGGGWGEGAAFPEDSYFREEGRFVFESPSPFHLREEGVVAGRPAFGAEEEGADDRGRTEEDQEEHVEQEVAVSAECGGVPCLVPEEQEEHVKQEVVVSAECGGVPCLVPSSEQTRRSEIVLSRARSETTGLLLGTRRPSDCGAGEVTDSCEKVPVARSEPALSGGGKNHRHYYWGFVGVCLFVGLGFFLHVVLERAVAAAAVGLMVPEMQPVPGTIHPIAPTSSIEVDVVSTLKPPPPGLVPVGSHQAPARKSLPGVEPATKHTPSSLHQPSPRNNLPLPSAQNKNPTTPLRPLQHNRPPALQYNSESPTEHGPCSVGDSELYARNAIGTSGEVQAAHDEEATDETTDETPIFAYSPTKHPPSWFESYPSGSTLASMGDLWDPSASPTADFSDGTPILCGLDNYMMFKCGNGTKWGHSCMSVSLGRGGWFLSTSSWRDEWGGDHSSRQPGGRPDIASPVPTDSLLTWDILTT